MDITYKIFTDGQHEYNLDVIENDDGAMEYSLVRVGPGWSSSVRDQVCLKITNNMSGYVFSKSSKSQDYAEMAEMYTLMNFIRWYETKDKTVPTSTIAVESCEKILEYRI